MIRLASIIHQFEAELLEQSQALLLPSQLKALSAMKRCRSELSLTPVATGCALIASIMKVSNGLNSNFKSRSLQAILW